MNTPDKIFTLLGSIVTVALVTTIAVNGKGLATLGTALGKVFTNSITAAKSTK